MRRPKAIPTYVLLKYITAERDKLQAKLNELVPYTKSLEQKLDKVCYEDVVKLKKENEGLRKQLDNAVLEAKTLRDDYRLSDWYAQLQANCDKAKSEAKRLKNHIKELAVQCRECRLKS